MAAGIFGQIDRRSKLPLYQQLYEILHDQIKRGALKPGDAIPAENQLVEHYQVSRSTVRQALDMLANEGLVARQRARGTFVTRPAVEQFADRIISFTEDMRRRGMEPGTALVSSGLVEASEDIARMLQVEPGESLACLERLRLADNEPISLEKSYLVHRYCPGILERDHVHEPLRDTLADVYGVCLVYARQTIRAVSPSRETATLLKIPLHVPVLLIERVTYSQDDQAVEYLRVCHRGDRYVLYNELQG